MAEAAVVDQIIQSHNEGAASLLDVACGTGAHLRHLRSRYEVVGLDIDPGMLEQAREALPGVTLVEGDMRSFGLAQRSMLSCACSPRSATCRRCGTWTLLSAPWSLISLRAVCW